LGAMAFETPTSIFIRRLALQNKTIYNTIFEENKLPTLAQFNPKFVYFEQQNNNILITANSTAPFLRYSIGDRGGTYLLTDLIKKFKNGGIDLITEFKKNKIPFTNLPFVYVYERADFSQSLYGLQVYPQHIKIAIEKKELQPFLTGKFAFNTYFDKQHDQYLQINLELKPNINTNTRLKKMTEDCIMNVLLENNSEFRELTNMLTRKRVKPRLIFWKYNHQLYFKSGIKQQWIKKHL
jgi:phenylacetate-CoA ligase